MTVPGGDPLLWDQTQEPPDDPSIGCSIDIDSAVDDVRKAVRECLEAAKTLDDAKECHQAEI